MNLITKKIILVIIYLLLTLLFAPQFIIFILQAIIEFINVQYLRCPQNFLALIKSAADFAIKLFTPALIPLPLQRPIYKICKYFRKLTIYTYQT